MRKAAAASREILKVKNWFGGGKGGTIFAEFKKELAK